MGFEEDFLVSESSNDSISTVMVHQQFENKLDDLDADSDFQAVVSKN